MPKTVKTDLQILKALLSLPKGRLTAREEQGFQGMYDKVASGHQAGLSIEQRMWASSVYDKHDLDKERPPARPVAIKDKSLLASFDDMPKPLKPPGRK
jgi:hypothetical protein